MRARRVAAAAALALGLPAVASAQVGYPPAQSPFRDLEYRQEVTVEGGYVFAGSEPAGVAPQAAPLAGVRWAMQFNNPFILSARLGTLFSERNVIDPAAAPENRFIRTEDVQLATLDLSLGLALTGFRSWHGIVPEVSAGVGVMSAFDDIDEGGFKVGTPLALTGGAGIRWVPGGRFQFRADLTHRMYRVSYPQSYYQTTGGESVLGASDSNSRWTHNPTVSIGIGYLFDR